MSDIRKMIPAESAHLNKHGARVITLAQEIEKRQSAGEHFTFRLARFMDGKLWCFSGGEYLCIDPVACRISLWMQHRKKTIGMIEERMLMKAEQMLERALLQPHVTFPTIDSTNPLSEYNDILTPDQEELLAEVGELANEFANRIIKGMFPLDDLPNNVVLRGPEFKKYICIGQDGGYWIVVDPWIESLGRTRDITKEEGFSSAVEWGARPNDIPICFNLLNKMLLSNYRR